MNFNFKEICEDAKSQKISVNSLIEELAILFPEMKIDNFPLSFYTNNIIYTKQKALGF